MVDVQTPLEAFLTCFLDLSVSLMKLAAGKKQNFWSWDYSPQCQNFRISKLLDVRLKNFFCILINLVEVCDNMNHSSILRIYEVKTSGSMYLYMAT